MQKRGPFASVVDLWRVSQTPATALHALAQADAFGSLGLDRRQALWAVRKLQGGPLPLFDGPDRSPQLPDEPAPLPAASASKEITRDYQTVGLSLKAHPLSLLREKLSKRRVHTAAEIRDQRCCPHGRRTAVAGLVLFRQRPSTAKGVMFMTLEDETGRADLIVRPRVYRACPAALFGQIVIARGRVERNEGVIHVLANSIEEWAPGGPALPAMSRDFR